MPDCLVHHKPMNYANGEFICPIPDCDFEPDIKKYNELFALLAEKYVIELRITEFIKRELEPRRSLK